MIYSEDPFSAGDPLLSACQKVTWAGILAAAEHSPHSSDACSSLQVRRAILSSYMPCHACTVFVFAVLGSTCLATVLHGVAMQSCTGIIRVMLHALAGEARLMSALLLFSSSRSSHLGP